MSIWKDHVEYILVEPAEPGNIGASARAIKTMGFGSLGIVNPPDISRGEARWFAHNAVEVLDNADIYGTLADAVRDKSLVVGTTRRTGRKRGLIVSPEQGAAMIYRAAKKNRVAIVFGREDRGLLNDEVGECAFLITIPASALQPSLNLSHAVMIISYELSKAPYRSRKGAGVTRERSLPSYGGDRPALVDQAELTALFDRVSRILVLLEYLPKGDEDLQAKIMLNLKRFIGRSGLTQWELKMLHGLCSAVERKWKE